MMIRRDLLDQIQPFLKRREFLSILGPRQCGKTTLLELLEEDILPQLKIPRHQISAVTFEDRKLLAQFEKDPILFIQSYLETGKEGATYYLMIDEFQYADNGGQKLKLIYDTLPNVKVTITGSSSLDIRAKVGKFMVGRILNFCLYPFNFREYLETRDVRLKQAYLRHHPSLLRGLREGNFSKIKKGKDLFHDQLSHEFEQFCIWGGYPAVVLAKSVSERKKLLSEIYNQYILKDVKTLLELATERELFLLSQYLATQIGGLAVYQNLGQVCGLDYRNLRKHLQILEETFVCRSLRPYFRNRQKELSKNPKFYFWDMGFRNYLTENMSGFEQRPDAGAIVENVIFIRLSELFEGIDKINFWRTKAGAEVDFILHEQGRQIPIEVKYTAMDSPKLSRSFMSFVDTFGPRYGIVLTKNYWDILKRGKTRILFAPVYYL